MAFPDNPEDLEIGVAFGASLSDDPTTLTYTPITPDYAEPYVQITRGRIASASQTVPTQIDFGLRNPEGIFSPRNVLGPHFGNLRQNTPVRVRLDPGSGMVTRGIAYIPDWPVEWTGPDMGDHISTSAFGLLSRLGQGEAPKSAMRRSVVKTGVKPVGYWPMEDGSSATAAAAVIGSGNMVLTGDAELGAEGPAGAVSVAAIRPGGRLAAAFGASATTAWTVAFLMQVPDSISAGSRVARWITTGGVRTWTLSLATGSPHTISLVGRDATGTVVVNDSTNFESPFTGSWYGQWLLVSVSVKENAGSLDYHIDITDSFSRSSFGGGTLASTTAGAVGELRFVADAGLAELLVGQAAVWDVSLYDDYFLDLSDLELSVYGFDGEGSGQRMLRLCVREEEIPVDLSGSASSATMGPQGPNTIVDIFRECEAAENGVLLERRTGEIGFDRVDGRLNADVAMTLDYEAGDVNIFPEDDDRDTVNVWTVHRPEGSSATVEQEDGPKGSDPETGAGRYEDSTTVNVDDDDQLANQAGWRVGLGTVDEQRQYATIDLYANPALIEDWLTCDIGSRIQITNPPQTRTGPGPLDLIIEGYRETIDATMWTVELWLMPYAPYRVGVWAETAGDTDPNLGWWDWDSCALQAAIDDNDTTAVVTALPTDATASDDFPRDVVLGGERLTVTASAITVADAFARTSASSWGSTDTGSYAWTTAGGSAADFSVSGGTGRHSMGTVNASRRCTLPSSLSTFDSNVLVTMTVPAVATGGSMTSGIMLAYVDASNLYQAALVWGTGGTLGIELIERVAAANTVLASFSGLATYTAGSSWKLRAGIADGRLWARAWWASRDEHRAWEVSAPATTFTAAGLIGVRTILNTGNTNVAPTFQYDDFEVESLRTWTVTRSVNDISKSHSAGAGIELAKPLIWTL